ncbi:GTP-binding protein [Peribacillus psychrosaccharolyticus]|uniref:GTP-binding protein n=1 Tax=Peribacillus psychrosaccharolyticus TaxID=1407 RepID=A0A974NM70_PERPY|nr:GTP-binding protein [Peribacillus psychrosaccharolyticus]MEC2056574.1 GTP-binding protein [Peribacillus psychrosaccharolyticus]MED3745706.1 GTP-binding protein [Peribacillus psychrosaccharolyticus]QQT00286.1 GTP-binding protein [Peribacillus psychrosaccharolyticus]
MTKRTEIYILGGFLGSGKTTLLKQIINQENEAGRKTAVLMNELGSVSVDTSILGDEVPVKELIGGCICCTIQDKLEAQLQELLIEDLDAIYIETTGAAHPVEVLDGIMSPIFAERLEYKGIITVLDLLRWKDRSELSPQLRHLLVEQLQHADFILLNKQDLVTEMEASQLLYSVQAINSGAVILLTTQAKVSLDSIRKLKMKAKGVHQKLDVHNHLHLQAIVHTFTNPVDQNEFENWLRSLPETVYRMKGYVSFTHSPYPCLFQYSYGMPLFMNEMMKMPLNMVIIGEQLNEVLIHDQLMALEKQ